jgi:hypothetical protein
VAHHPVVGLSLVLFGLLMVFQPQLVELVFASSLIALGVVVAGTAV